MPFNDMDGNEPPRIKEDMMSYSHSHEVIPVVRKKVEGVKANGAPNKLEVSGDYVSRLNLKFLLGIRIKHFLSYVRWCKSVVKQYFGKLSLRSLFSVKQESYLQITTSKVDIYLADSNSFRPYIYVATNESRLALAVKVCDRPTAQSSIDFINQIPFRIRTIRTEAREEFQGEFKTYLERRGIRHEFTLD